MGFSLGSVGKALGGAVSSSGLGGILGGSGGGSVGGILGGFAGLGGLSNLFSGPGHDNTDEALKADQLAILQQQMSDQTQMRPFQLQQMGLIQDPTTGQMRRMTQDETMAAMTPMEQQQYKLQQTLLDQQTQAAAGTLALPTWLQSDLDKTRTDQTEAISRAYGPNASASTAGIQAKTAQDVTSSQIKDAYAHGQQTTGAQLYSGYTGLTNQMNQQGLSNYSAFPNTSGGILGNMNSVLSPYYQQQMGKQQQQSQLAGSIFGAAGTAGGAYLGGM
jgi:hypothetical protein